MPLGPLAFFSTVRVARLVGPTGSRSKLASTDLAALIVTSQVPVPEQPLPLQPVNSEPDSAEALSVTTVPSSNSFSHSAPQTILGEAGEVLSTVPEPVPVLETVSLKLGLGISLKIAFTATSSDPSPNT